MTHSVSVQFTENPPTLQGGGPVPGTWVFTGTEKAEPDGNVILTAEGYAHHVHYILSNTSTSGWVFHSISISQDSGDTTFVSVSQRTALLSYPWGQLQVTHLEDDDEVHVEITNTLAAGSPEVTLGVVLTLSNGAGQMQSSRDPQIVLKPNAG